MVADTFSVDQGLDVRNWGRFCCLMTSMIWFAGMRMGRPSLRRRTRWEADRPTMTASCGELAVSASALVEAFSVGISSGLLFVFASPEFVSGADDISLDGAPDRTTTGRLRFIWVTVPTEMDAAAKARATAKPMVTRPSTRSQGKAVGSRMANSSQTMQAMRTMRSMPAAMRAVSIQVSRFVLGLRMETLPRT